MLRAVMRDLFVLLLIATGGALRVPTRILRRPRPVSATAAVLDGTAWQNMPICNDPRWETVRLDDDDDSQRELFASAGEAIRCGGAVLVVPELVTPAECAALVEICTGCADEVRDWRAAAGHEDPAGQIRLPTIAAWERMQAAGASTASAGNFALGAMPPEADTLCEQILRRAIAFVDAELPSVAATCFGTPTISELHDGGGLEFSGREPAINVYGEGGGFLAHKDHQALTVLIPLTAPDEFAGGGTGFWTAEQRGHRVEGPSVVLRPEAGSAMLFGGKVTHAGLEITSGRRVVFVASFSPLGGRQQRAEEAAQSRDLYGDLK